MRDVVTSRQCGGYLLALAGTVVALLLGKGAAEVLGASPYLAFYPAVVIAAVFGGTGPGLVTTVALGICGDLMFDTTPGWVDWGDPVAVERLIVFVVGGGIISLMAGMQRAAQISAQDYARKLRVHTAALDTAANGIFITDAKGTVIWANWAVEVMTGYAREEILGQNPRILKSDKHEDAFYRGMWETIQQGKVWRGELINRRKDGTLYDEEMTITPVQDEQGRISHFIAIKQDISQRKAAEEELRANRADLNRAQAVAHIGSWRLDVRHNRLLWSDETHRIFGIPRGTALSAETFFAAVHPEDRAMVEEKWQATLRGEPYDLEHRIIAAGAVKWIHQKAELELDEHGEPVGGFGTVQDITRRKQTEEALAAAIRSAEHAKAQAEEASRAKDHFLAVLSHELRTPLTPVLATVSMLQSEGCFDQDTRQNLEVIRRNTELEARLIDDLLDITRIARGKVELDKQIIPLCELIMQAIEVCQPDIEARSQHFGVDMEAGSSFFVMADAARLQQVFWNLLKNAIKFTPPGGYIRVRCRPDGPDAVVVEVADNGEGIEPQALKKIFNAFEQAERSITRQFGGLGLGLAISKALVEMHGGRLEAHSEGKGKGATFRVWLPLASTPATDPAGSKPGADEPQAESGRRTGLRSRGAEPSRRLRILLVEDHGDTARIMTRLLVRRGHEVKAAGDVASALALIDLSGFDLLVSDLGLPDRSGLDLIRELRSRGQTLPAIALSGYGQEEDVRRSREAGFNAHLTKPVDFEQFYRTITAVTG